uniref:Uncharacterized protein n=1 Tax=Globisporangium ultimum (strain ATCC 200006 / CBS 805.95 / DAOM BR144) TaxID=431595 RepID=K3X717_GLOUD
MTLSNPLKPTPIAPEWSSPWHHMVAILRKIEYIKIESLSACETGTFVIEIFEATSTNRIPTNRSRSRDRSTAMVARVERECTEFNALRTQVYIVVHNAHAESPCEFCKSVMDLFWAIADLHGGSFRDWSP